MSCRILAVLAILASVALASFSITSPTFAAGPFIRPIDDGEDWGRYLAEQGFTGAGALADTVWFGGDGFGNVTRGGVWDWETDSGERPELFPDGDPVGNQFRDGWTFDDRTSRRDVSQLGAGHWDAAGNYDFENDDGSFAHRATFHANDGVDDGPDPLGGGWSVWIGTNLLLNPEHCGWQRTAGYGNGWSQGIQKQFAIDADPGAQISLDFFHRYAVEFGQDTCRVELSGDGVSWHPVGDAGNPVGLYTDGNRLNPLPSPPGGAESIDLVTWSGGAGDLFVRFRLVSDLSYSDEAEGGDLLFAWQIDDIVLSVDAVPIDTASFESGMDGWQPARFEGADFELTMDPLRPAGRIEHLDNLACPPEAECPEECALAGNVLLFADRDDCDLGDRSGDSFARSPAFSIAGAGNPDIADYNGRLLRLDAFFDGGSGEFATGLAVCAVYSPSSSNQCPYTPPGGDPGAGTTFAWSRTSLASCEYVSQGVGATCLTAVDIGLAAGLPAVADSVIVFLGAFSSCASTPGCDPNDNGAPLLDNVRFGVYDVNAMQIRDRSIHRYSDSFPLAGQAHAGLDPSTARMDVGYSFPAGLGIELPLRFVRADTASIDIGSDAGDVTAHLRWRTVPGPCQDQSNAFWSAYPPGVWHEARMDTARAQGTGTTIPWAYMTCFHEFEPNDGTSWGGEATAIEPCDDILPDGVFSAGTRMAYFFEVRDAATGEVLGTAPAVGGNLIDTTNLYTPFWRTVRILPELVAGGGCDPEEPADRAHDFLVVHGNTNAVHESRLTALLDSFGVGYDLYYEQGTNFTDVYNGIGRREDRNQQPPRPPHNGATTAQLDPYRCIWYAADMLDSRTTLSDQLTTAFFGGQPSNDQQKLEQWLDGCTDGDPRFLVLDGYGWASDIDVNTTNGPAFLANVGVSVVDNDYTDLTDDIRRCARITGSAIAASYDAQVWATGCPEYEPADVFAAASGGEVVANYVDGAGTVDCADDSDLGASNAAIIRHEVSSCARSAALAAPVVRIHDLDCTASCLFDDWTLGSATAQLLSDLFAWAGRPIGNPVGLPAVEPVPELVTQLIGAHPNPANPRATIRFTLATKGAVRLDIVDVTGRRVRRLVDGVLDASGDTYEIVWDGVRDSGQVAASGVYFYVLEAPEYTASKKLVILK